MSIERDVDISWTSYREANEAFEHGHFHKAVRILREALEQSRQQGFIDPLILQTANDVADRHLVEGDYLTAASLFRIILEVRQSVQGQEHPDVVASRKRLAYALWQTGGITPKMLTANQ